LDGTGLKIISVPEERSDAVGLSFYLAKDCKSDTIPLQVSQKSTVDSRTVEFMTECSVLRLNGKPYNIYAKVPVHEYGNVSD